MRKTLLVLNKLNGNDRLYRTDVVEKAISEYIGKEVYLEYSKSGSALEVNLENVVGIITDMNIEGDLLIGDVNILDRCPAELKVGFENDEFVARPFGIGEIDEHRQVWNYKLVGFLLTNDPA